MPDDVHTMEPQQSEEGSPNPPDTPEGPRVRNYLLRLLIALLFVAGAIVAAGVIQAFVRDLGVPTTTSLRIVYTLLTVVLVAYAYRVYVRWIERRRVTELALPGALRELAFGLVLGFGLIAVSVGILAAAGVYRVNGVGFPFDIVKFFFLFTASVFIEELLVRGILLRLLEEGLGSLFALVFTAFLFGFMHSANDGANAFSSVAVGIEGGLMVGLVWMATRRLWMVIGLHFAWNYTQSALFGLNVSGVEAKGLLAGSLTGPELLTGGQFGLENTIVALLITTIISVYAIQYNLTYDRFLAPAWLRERRAKRGE